MCIDLVSAAPPRVAPELAVALARAQGEFGTIRKARAAHVQTRTGGAYSYSFADLAAVLEAVRPALAKHELALVQLPSVRQVDGAAFVVVETILAHGSGHSISTTLELAISDSTPQAIGSGLTYARRYSLLALLGVAAEDEDDDAEGALRRDTGSRTACVREGFASGSTQIASDKQIKLIWSRARARARCIAAAGYTDLDDRQLSEEIVRGALPNGIGSTKELFPNQVDGVLERIEVFEVPPLVGCQPPPGS